MTAMVVYTDRDREPFIIDADDYEAVSRYSWCIGTQGYVETSVGKAGTKYGTLHLSLHRFLLGKAPENLVWDHIDRNKLNNQRSNFRAVSRRMNAINSGLQRNSYSGVLGVHKIKTGRPRCWQVHITYNGCFLYLGSFRNFEMACAKRWAAERQLWPQLFGVQ